MPLVRPRLTDHYDISIAQAACDFAIPLLDEDLPLYVDPFLMWKSPSLQDQALHGAIVAVFDRLIYQFANGDQATAVDLLVRLSECPEAGLGLSATRAGRRMGVGLARETLSALASVPQILQDGVRHIETAQLLVNGLGADRVSDIASSIIKSFLIDFTIEQCTRHGIPTGLVTMPDVLDHAGLSLSAEQVFLPLSPSDGRGVLLVPKRWLRFSPWIGADPYFAGGFVDGADVPTDRVAVLLYNRANYGLVESFVSQREAQASRCSPDPIFQPISITSAKRRLSTLKGLPTGKAGNADKKYENLAGGMLASVLYPQLDFAAEQVRTDSGAQIRDVIFYNTRTWDFLADIHGLYGSRQVVFELKNVQSITRDHVNQLNRYLTEQFGRFGVLVTRNPVSAAIERNLIDLWAGQRRCILVLTDDDLALMVNLFETGQRMPIEVLKRAYVTFSRKWPA